MFQNCRIGEGALSAVTYLNGMIMEVSENYTKDAYIFKGDFKSFFMSMSKSLLWEMIDLFIRDNYKGDDIECLLYILRTVIFHQPQHKCYRNHRYIYGMSCLMIKVCFMLIRIMVLPPAVFMRRNSQILSALVLITMFPKYWESSIMCVLWMISPL